MKKLLSLILALCLLLCCGVASAAGSDMVFLGGAVTSDNSTTISLFVPVDTSITANDLEVRVDNIRMTTSELSTAATTWVFIVDNYEAWGNWKDDLENTLDAIADNMGAADNGIVLSSDSTWNNTVELKLTTKGQLKDDFDKLNVTKKTGVTMESVTKNLLSDLSSVQGVNPHVCLVLLSNAAGIQKGAWDGVKETAVAKGITVYTIGMNLSSQKAEAFSAVATASLGGQSFITATQDKNFPQSTASAIHTAEKHHAIQLTIGGASFFQTPSEFTITLKNANPALSVTYKLSSEDKSHYNVLLMSSGSSEEIVIEDETPWYQKTEYLVVGGLVILLVILLIVLLISGKKRKAKKAAEAKKAEEARKAAEAAKKDDVSQSVATVAATAGFTSDAGETEVIARTVKAGSKGDCHLQLKQMNSTNVYTADFRKTLLVGRSREKADLVVYQEDKKISGVNAEFSFSGGVMTLKDKGSTNGTYLNGSRLTTEMRVNQNDIVKMGLTQFRVSWTIL